MPKNDLYETIRSYNNEIFDVVIQNLAFLKEILVPISDKSSKISEMIFNCEQKKIEVKHISKDDINILHFTIIGSGLEYVLNHLKFIGKPPSPLKTELNSIQSNYPESLLSLLEILTESFSSREVESAESGEYQSIMHLQDIVFNNLFKIVINCFRLLKVAECNYVTYLKIINNILHTYLKKYKKEFAKFKPFLLVIIENVMHMRKEMGKRKELNDIMLNLPLGIKFLIEYMPFIFEFIQESIHNKDESGAIETLTHWIRVISNLNDIIDPIMSPTLSEFTADLFEAFYNNYHAKSNNYSSIFWIISKLGPKARIYNDDKIIHTKEDTWNCLKIVFKDKNSGDRSSKFCNTYTLSLDHILGTNGISNLDIDQPHKYLEHFETIMEFFIPCLLFSINPNSMDTKLVKNCIKNVLTSPTNEEIFNDVNKPRVYPNDVSYYTNEDPKTFRQKQIRSIEVILRMMIAGCFIDDKKFEKVYNKTKENIKHITCHFVLIYICKNGRLQQKVNDVFCEQEQELLESREIEIGSESFLKRALSEINPLIFLDIICEFLHENNQNPTRPANKPFSAGWRIVLNEIFILLKSFYPNSRDYAVALDRLEFVNILIKKICYLSYSEGIQKKIGCINALKIIIDHCPSGFIKRYNTLIVESCIVIIKSIPLSYGGLPSKLVTGLLMALAKKSATSDEILASGKSPKVICFFEDEDEMRKIVELIFKNVKEVNCKGRRILENFLDSIRKSYASKHSYSLRRRKRDDVKKNVFPEVYREQLNGVCSQILAPKSPQRKLDLLLEGYCQIENIINEVDIILHLFKHNCLESINGDQILSFINQLIEILEYEIEVFNSTIVNKHNFATKFFLLEKLHIDHNKVHDLYSATKYQHRLFNLSFEKPRSKNLYVTKGSQMQMDADYINNYYNTYLEDSMNIQMEVRNDYDQYLSDLFPNHDQHVELMTLIIYLLAQFSSNQDLLDSIRSQYQGEIERKIAQTINIMKSRITILMMCCVLRIEEKLSATAEKNLAIIPDDFEYSDKIYEHLEAILKDKMISNENYYKEVSIIKLFRIVYKKKIDEEKIKRIFESAVDGIKAVETSVQNKPPGINTINHCRFVYEMINIFISVNWFSNNEDSFIRSFDRKVFDIATNMHKKVLKIPFSGSDLIDKYSFRDLMCKYMNEKNTWGNHWQIWLQNKRIDILELILDVLDMDESYPFRDRFIRYYDLRILCRDMMNNGRDRNERMLSNHMRGLINKYFNVLNKRIPSAFVNTIKFLELLFSILKDRINKTPESLNAKENRLICKIILDFFISFIKYSKNPCTLLLYTIELYSENNSFLFEDFNKLLSDFIPKHFYCKKIASLIKGTMKCFERSFQCVCNVLSCLWVPVLNKIAKQGRDKFQQVIDFNFFQKLIKTLLDPEQGFVYEWINKRDDEIEIERPITEVYKVLALCSQNHDLDKLDRENKEILIDFYWKMIKLKYSFKQWHIFAISEFFKNVKVVEERVNEVYLNILESSTNETSRGKMLQNIAIDNIISLMNLKDVCSIKKTVNFLKQDENTLIHIADILIKYEIKFFEDVKNYSNDIKSILHKIISSNYASSLDKNKIVLYLCEVCLKWMRRINKNHSISNVNNDQAMEVDEVSINSNRLNIHPEYVKTYQRLDEAVSICMQKELKIILSNITNCSSELLLKYLIMFRDIHTISPLFSVEAKISVDSTLPENDPKEKKLFILNILNMVLNSTLQKEFNDSKINLSIKERREKIAETISAFYKPVNHSYIYSIVCETIPKIAHWAKRSNEDIEWLGEFLGKRIMQEILEVTRIIDEKSQQLGEGVIHRWLPHISVRILNVLSSPEFEFLCESRPVESNSNDPKSQSSRSSQKFDISHFITRVIWIYRKLFLFLEHYFKKPATVGGISTNGGSDCKLMYKGIYFSTENDLKSEISNLHYSQETIVYSMKIAAMKLHEFDISFLDEYLKLLDSIITYCKNEELSLIIYEIYECLLLAPNPNSLGVKINLSLAKKVWLGSCLLKKAVGDNSKKLKDKMENVITDMLVINRLNNIDEIMNLYDYAAFFFRDNENKQKIQRAFEASFGGGLFTKLRLILENKDNMEFTQMNSPPIIMRKISDAIMSSIEGCACICHSSKSMVLRDLSNSDGSDVEMKIDDENVFSHNTAYLDNILNGHKEFLDDPKMRDEKFILETLKSITNIHESKYFYHNVKKLFPQVWRSFTKEQKNYLSQCITQFFSNYIKFLQNQKKKLSPEFEVFPNDLLEILQQLEPQIALGPDFFQKASSKNNCWINCVLMLEQQVKAVPNYDRYIIILNELYNTLEQDDYFINKCNSKVLKKAITYSQLRMWEEVNSEFNKALLHLVEGEEVNVDLKYCNEYDQKVWEDLHPESILQIGDLDRTKFFSQSTQKNYGAFKAEFQKWMILGKTQPTYQVFEGNREKLCQEWTSLPRFIDQVHNHRLTKFQEYIELIEIMALLNNCRTQPKEKSSKDFCTAAAIQRERVPISCESNRVWRDILENRYIPFVILNNMLESKKKAPNESAQEREPKRSFAFKRLLNYVWDKALIARQSRKQDLLEVSKRYLIEVESMLKRSDEEDLKGNSLNKEKYVLLSERLKLILHQFRNNVRLNLRDEELVKIRSQLLSRGLEISDPKELEALKSNENEIITLQEISDIYRLRGEIYFEAKHYNDANQCFLKSLELCSTSRKNWFSLAKTSENFAEMAIKNKRDPSEIIDWTCTAVEAYMKTLKHHLFNSRFYIVKVLDLISKNSKYIQDNQLQIIFERSFQNSQVWVWLFWIPQLLDFILRSNSEYEVAKIVLSEIAKFYPQHIFLALRMFYWYPGINNKQKIRQEGKAKVTSLGKHLFTLINEQSNTIKDTIDTVIKELEKGFSISIEEELYGLIEKGYSMCFSYDFKPDKYLEKLWAKFFENKNDLPEFVGNTLKTQFKKDFMEESSKDENKYVAFQEKFKKWKDLISRRLSLKFAPTSLIEISKRLANFNYRSGMELPGQYLEIDTEPFPERKILIARFEPNIFIGGLNKNRIIIRANTGKRYMYSTLKNTKAYEYPTKTDERLTQFKVFLNKIFKYEHPETMRRGVKLGVYNKIILPYIKLTEENNLSTLDEIYKIACAEYGIDNDAATCLYTKEMKIDIEKKNIEDRQTISQEEFTEKVKLCNKCMRRIISKDYLSNHFKSIIKTVDEYFMYRKQFSQYYAANCFFTYILSLDANNLQNIKICSKYGRVFHSECKLSYDRTTLLPKNNEEKVPFRLSDNIKEFICPVGQAGILPIIITCCSLASEKKDPFIRSFLRIFFLEEEILTFKNSEECFANAVEDVMRKIHSLQNPYLRTLSNPEITRPCSQSASVTSLLYNNKSQLRYLTLEENKEEVESLRKLSNLSINDDKGDLNSTGFNRVAYDLVEEASNKQTLMSTDLCYASWF